MNQPQPATTPHTAPAWTVSLFVSSLALWTGAAVFLSAGIMPTLFGNLESSEAGRVAALLFPVYFRAGLVLGVIATLAAFFLGRGGGRRWTVVLALLASMTAAQAWTTLVVHPEIAEIRGVDIQADRFQQLHQLSVRLNGLVVGGGLVLLAASGYLFSRRREET